MCCDEQVKIKKGRLIPRGDYYVGILTLAAGLLHERAQLRPLVGVAYIAIQYTGFTISLIILLRMSVTLTRPQGTRPGTVRPSRPRPWVARPRLQGQKFWPQSQPRFNER